MDDKAVRRDKKGDIIIPKISDDILKEFRDSRWKHIFHFQDSGGHFIEVDYEKDAFEGMRTDLPHFDLVNYKLFEHDLPVSEEWLRWRNQYDTYVQHFFQAVFKERITRGAGGVDKFELILPKEKFGLISKFIKEAGLEPHKDFIFFLISKIEEVYVHDVSYYDTPEQKRRLKKFPGEVNALHRVLKQSESKAWKNDEIPPRLEEVVFKFNKGASVKIKDPLLTSSIAHGTILDFSNGIQKNWEKQLLNFPSVFDENHIHNQFRDRTCKALHNFFKHVKAFDYGKSNVVDKELFAIGNILDAAHVKFHNKKGQNLDIQIDIYDIKQQIKNAIKRKELKSISPHITAQEIQPDIKLLLEYFDESFLKAGTQIYDVDDISVIGGILHRFEIEELGRELIFIYDCLKMKRFQIGFQFETAWDDIARNNADYQTWKELFKVLNSDGGIKSLSINLDDDRNIGFKEALSVDIIKTALRDYYAKNKFEFDVDFFESTIEQPTAGSFKVNYSGKLHQPQNRFLPVFTKQFYNYLLNAWPPGDNEWNPSDKYFKVIAAVLMRIFNMGDQMFNEDFIVAKVKAWFER